MSPVRQEKHSGTHNFWFFFALALMLATTASYASAQPPQACHPNDRRCVETTIVFQGWINQSTTEKFYEELERICAKYIQPGPAPDWRKEYFPASLNHFELWIGEKPPRQKMLKACTVYQGPGKPGGWSKEKGLRDEILQLLNKYVQSKEAASKKPIASLQPLIEVAGQADPNRVGGKIRPMEDGGNGP